MTLIVPKQTARAVAEHYGIDPRAFRRWMRRNQNVRLLGTLDSPAMQSTVERFRLCGSLTNSQLIIAHEARSKTCPSCGGNAPWHDEAWVCGACGDEWTPDHFRTETIHIDNEYRGRGLARRSK
jgi:hypothetical protein